MTNGQMIVVQYITQPSHNKVIVYIPRHSYWAVVVWKIARHTNSSPFIRNSDHMSSPGDRRVTDPDWHFNPRPINCDLAVREHLELATTSDDSQALLDWSSSHGAIIVDNDAKRATDEVSRQQVRAVARELEEATIERHEVLGASQAGVTCIITVIAIQHRLQLAWSSGYAAVKKQEI